MATEINSRRPLDEVFLEVQNKYMPSIYDEIRKSVAVDMDDKVEYREVVRAFELYFSCARCPSKWYERFGVFFQTHLFLFVAAAMAVIFGYFGNQAGIGPNGARSASATGFLDIAKIFAGALVGSAANTTAEVVRSSKSRSKVL